jgi:hypothetical protein
MIKRYELVQSEFSLDLFGAQSVNVAHSLYACQDSANHTHDAHGQVPHGVAQPAPTSLAMMVSSTYDVKGFVLYYREVSSSQTHPVIVSFIHPCEA